MKLVGLKLGKSLWVSCKNFIHVLVIDSLKFLSYTLSDKN